MAFSRRRQRGFTLIEALIAATIGLLLLAGLVRFLLNTSRSVQIGQQQAQNTSRAQQALSRITEAIKETATQPPRLFAATPNWNQLPQLPYTGTELFPYPVTSGAVTLPSYPAARKFAAQATTHDLMHEWFPNPDLNPQESNSLVFYELPPPGPGQVGQIRRVTFRLDTTDPTNQKLVREVQAPLTPSSVDFQKLPNPTRTVIVEQVERIQFTYPIFETEIDATRHQELLQLRAVSGAAAVQQLINTRGWRSNIAIRLMMQGAKIGNKQVTGIDLKTEVRLRNE